MSRLRRQDNPPERGPNHFVRRLKAREEATFTILSEHFWGTWVHWDGARTTPCESDDDSCPGHRRGLPCKWKGWLCCHNHDNRNMEFLEFTRVAARCLLEQLEKGASLRAYRLVVKRGCGDKTKVKVTVLPPMQTRDAIAPGVDPQETLEILWEMNGKPKLKRFNEDDLADVG
jgi:hypothetical protein